jgi:hypothetical protein
MNCLCDSSKVAVAPSEDGDVVKRVQEAFPGAIRSADLAQKIQSVLSKHGYEDRTTLVATSLCCDEVNRELELDINDIYSHNFNMGGLAGFAFGGVTSFGAMSHHIPEKGSCLVVYGPHVGVDRDGMVGKVNRRGRGGSGACCGSAAAACAYVTSVHEGAEKQEFPGNPLDAQQYFVGNMLLPEASRIVNAEEKEVELPLALFDVQDEFMKTIVSKGCGEVAGEGKIALLGGIQINTPYGTSEYFLPKVFEIKNNKNEKIADLMASF